MFVSIRPPHRAILRAILPLALLLCLATGCSHVTGNYPRIALYREQILPDFHVHDEQLARLVWREPGAVHGFLVDERRAQSMADRLEIKGLYGDQRAARDAKLFRVMALARLAYAQLQVYTVLPVNLQLATGDMRIVFLDGQTIADRGVILFPPGDDRSSADATTSGIVWLCGADDVGMDGRAMYVFFPVEHLRETVLAMDYQGVSEVP